MRRKGGMHLLRAIKGFGRPVIQPDSLFLRS